MIEIDKSLNLVIPIKRADDTKIYIHSTPIRYEMFEKFWKVLGKTYAEFTHNGFDSMTGPSLAAICLREVAENTARTPNTNWWDGDDGVGGKMGLMAEIRRLSNVLAMSSTNDCAVTPLQVAIDQNHITEKERRKAENLLVFFTVVSLVAPENDGPKLVRGMAYVYELQTTSLNCTEYANSLKTSIIADNSGKSAPAS